jgi:hypothetical protein
MSKTDDTEFVWCRYLQHIPNETVLTFEKGAQTGQSITRPLMRSIQVVEESLKVSSFKLLLFPTAKLLCG